MIGILGRKLGMTQIFEGNGRVIPVTVVEAGPCCVIQVKTMNRDGYEAVSLGFAEERKVKKTNKPMSGMFKKAGVKPCRVIREFKMGNLKVGEYVRVDMFAKGDVVKVSGVSKGKGFQGVMKRLNYHGGPASHGSTSYREVGSIGASSFPSRVWKNKGMPGHMGSERVTVKNLKIVDIRPEQNLLLIEGAVPGGTDSYIEIKKEY